VLTRIPEALAVGAGALLGLFAGIVLRVRRREVDRHLALAFPDRPTRWRARTARRSYAHLGREAVALFRMMRWPVDEIRARTRMEGVEELLRSVEGDKGVVILTGHLGNWEIAGAGLAARDLPIDVIGKGMANRPFEADLFEMRERLGMRVIEMGDAPRGVLRSLSRGRVAAIVGDQNAHRHGVFVPFFGRVAATARGPAVFALRSGAPVFFGYALREKGRRQRYVLRAVRLAHAVTGDLDADVRSLLAAYHARLEDAIRHRPEQYFWHHRRWKTRPPSEREEQGSGGAVSSL